MYTYPNTLIHSKAHKYIRKYRKNGKWRYVYDNTIGRIHDYADRLTGTTHHLFTTTNILGVGDGKSVITDENTGAAVTYDHRTGKTTVPYLKGSGGVLNGVTDFKVSTNIFGTKKQSISYEKNGRKFVTTSVINKKGEFEKLYTKDKTVDTGIERAIQKGKSFVSSITSKFSKKNKTGG